jgi:hypothetical protein
LATKISTPLALGGFSAAIFFFILRQLIEKNIFPALNKQASSEVIKIIIDRLFILALVAMVLGFAGYVIPKQVPVPPTADNYPINNSSYDGLVGKIYSYKKVVGPPPNVGVISEGLIGLRKYPERKEHILIILSGLKHDSYLTNPVFSKEYDQLMKVIDKTKKVIEAN